MCNLDNFWTWSRTRGECLPLWCVKVNMYQWPRITPKVPETCNHNIVNRLQQNFSACLPATTSAAAQTCHHTTLDHSYNCCESSVSVFTCLTSLLFTCLPFCVRLFVFFSQVPIKCLWMTMCIYLFSFVSIVLKVVIRGLCSCIVAVGWCRGPVETDLLPSPSSPSNAASWRLN